MFPYCCIITYALWLVKDIKINSKVKAYAPAHYNWKHPEIYHNFLGVTTANTASALEKLLQENIIDEGKKVLVVTIFIFLLTNM